MEIHLAGFTEAEIKLLETVLELIEEGVREDFDKKAALKLGLAEVTIRSRWSRLRSKREANKIFSREYRGWQQKLYQKTGGKFHKL